MQVVFLEPTCKKTRIMTCAFDLVTFMKIYPCRRGWIGALGELRVFHWGEEEDLVEATGLSILFSGKVSMVAAIVVGCSRVVSLVSEVIITFVLEAMEAVAVLPVIPIVAFVVIVSVVVI